MTGAESIVLALTALEKAREAVLLPQCFKSVCSAGEKLVRVPLMSDVPDNSIAGCIEHRMQRDRQLDDAESGADVSACTRTDLDQAGAHFFRDCAQLVARHRLQIRWGVDAVEDGHSERGQDVRVTMKLATCDSSRVSNPCLRRLSRPSSINACAR